MAFKRHQLLAQKAVGKDVNLRWCEGLDHPAGESDEAHGPVHLIPALSPPADSPGTERAVRSLGVKQRDLLGAKQEAEPALWF